MSETWIPVDRTALNQPRQKKVDGVEVTVMASPYDVPDAYRSHYDAEKDRHILEFRYLTEEPKKRENHGQYITLLVGKNSRRIYGVEIDSAALRKHFWLSVTVSAIGEQEQRSGPSQNYNIARRLLRTHAPRLEQAFAFS
jgi:hypothetical protein